MALQTESLPISELDLFRIEPAIGLPSQYAFSYLHTIQEILKTLIPSHLLENAHDLGSFFFQLGRELPLAKIPSKISHEEAIPVTFLCPADYTPGVGRFIADSLSRWLVPGKNFPIIGRVSLNFRFSIYPSSRFYLTQEMLAVQDPKDLELVKKALPPLIEEMRINIMAVYHARYISSLKSTQSQNRHLIFQENFSALLNTQSDLHTSLFDEFQKVLTKISSEEKVDQIKKNISYLMRSRPKTFDRDIFYEIAHSSNLFKAHFSSKRSSRHISRIIAYQYLFKKVAQKEMAKNPKKRHLSLKILKGPGKEPSLALFFTFNFLREAECFELRHLAEGVRASLPYVNYLADSLITDRRDEKIRFFYIELVKKGKDPFTKQEIQHLKEKLPSELMKQIETTVHPIFMPRNEEEVLRNLILLSKQIKYVKDLPQISIHYDTQSDSDLVFTIIIVRLLKNSTLPIERILTKLHPIKVELDSVRNGGYLKRKYKKEAAILRVELDKNTFFRADFSVDLLKARQKIVRKLSSALGEFRDFNGGIILKQEEALTQLRKSLPPLKASSELLLENYFYSLRPAIMQTVYETSVLKKHFLLFQNLFKEEIQQKTYLIKKELTDKYLLCFVLALSETFKDFLMREVQKLHIPSHDLTVTHVHIDQKSFLGFILRFDQVLQREVFEKKVEEVMKKWDEHFLCPLPTS